MRIELRGGGVVEKERETERVRVEGSGAWAQWSVVEREWCQEFVAFSVFLCHFECNRWSCCGFVRFPRVSVLIFSAFFLFCQVIVGLCCVILVDS